MKLAILFGRALSFLLLGRSVFNGWFPFGPLFQWCYLTVQRSPDVTVRGNCRVLISGSSQVLSVTCLFPVVVH